jgi:hypothetical protein
MRCNDEKEASGELGHHRKYERCMNGKVVEVATIYYYRVLGDDDAMKKG